MAVCYRHPSRETGVSCSSCGKPICPDCMTPTSVGMRCPACAGEKTKVRNIRSIQRAHAPVVTYAIIILDALVYVAETAGGGALTSTGNTGTLIAKFGLNGPSIHIQHEYYRLLSAGFLHLNLLHIVLNVVFLYFIGGMLEPAIGRVYFAAVYFASLLAGSFGALVFTAAGGVGASGAGYGLLAALIVVARDRGIPIWQSGLGITLLLNVLWTLSVPNISIGGHLGGLVGGFICGLAVVQLGERRGNKWAVLAACAAVAVVSVAGAIAVSGSMGIAPNGIKL